MAYLAAAARYGASAQAAAELAAWDHRFAAPSSTARAAYVRARAAGSADALLDAAVLHAELGFVADAAELAELAVAAMGPPRSEARVRATALAEEMRRRIRHVDTAPAPIVPLTRRELEVARLATRGLSDHDIGETLFISTRTVESHLAAAYRKLGIRSRRELRGAL